MTRCPRHGLAVPPGGTCIVCRREARGKGGLPAWLYALVGLTLAGLLVFGIVRTVFQRAETVTAEPPPPLPLQRFAASTATPVPSTRQTVEAVGSAVPAWFTDEQSRLPEERKRVSITVYSTSWCPSCRAAKAWLASHHQPYFERDIELDAEAKVRMHKLNPAGGVPTINIEDEIFIGFDGPAMDRAIDGAARRHIARAGSP